MPQRTGNSIVIRVLSIIPVLVVVSVLIFIAMRIVPGNPVQVLAQGSPLTLQQQKHLTIQYGFNRPIYAQYLSWAAHAIQGNFGSSLLRDESVSKLIVQALPPTVILLGGAFIVAMVLSVLLGTVSALREGKWLDQGIVSFTLLLLSVPLFVSGTIIIYVFSYRLSWFPAFGFSDSSLSQLIDHMALPWVTLGLALVAVQTATLRAGLVDALHEEYVLMATSRGVSRWKVIARHAGRAALIPVVTLLGLQLAYMVVGSVFVDYIFGLGGLGSLLVNSVNSRDLPVVQGCVMVVATFFVLANLAVDLVAARLDIRYKVR